MTVALGSNPRYLEELRIGGGYGSSPDGGTDFDRAGNIAANGGLDIDGPAQFGGALTVGGEFAITGADTTWSTYLPASVGMPDPVLPCGPVTAVNWRNFNVATPTLAFEPDNPKAAYFQFRLPPTYDGRPLTFTLEWGATAGTSGDVRWGVLPISFLDGNTLVETGSTTYVNDLFLGVETFQTCSVSVVPNQASTNSMNTLRVIRLSSDSADTFDADALLIGLGISL